MKVLFNTYYHAFQNPGGGEIVLMKTKEGLEKKGIEVALFDLWNTKISDYDIMHDFSNLNWRHWEGFKQYGVKLAVTPVFWPNDKFPNPQKQLIKSKLQNLIGHSTPQLNQWNAMRIPDIFFPTTNMEMEKIKRFYSLPENTNFTVINNGIEIINVDENKANVFTDHYHIKDYLLYVGRISPQKNVDKIIASALNTQNKLVIIGDADQHDVDFASRLKTNFSDRVLFISHLPHQSEILLDAYRGAKALIVASFFETCSLVGLEAGSLGVPVIMTEVGATKEVYQNHVCYVNPYQLNTIEEAIKNISKKERPDQKLKDYIAQNFSWDKTADALINSYLSVLQRK